METCCNNSTETNLTLKTDDPASSLQKLSIPVKYSTLFITTMALLENLFIVGMVCSRQKLRRQSRVFMTLCLSFSDSLFSAVIMCFSIFAMIPGLFDIRVCFLLFPLLHISFATSMIQTLLICVERYVATQFIVHMDKFNEHKHTIVVVGWIAVATYVIMPFSILSTHSGIKQNMCRFEVIYGNNRVIFGTLVCLYIPILITIVFLYSFTANVLISRLKRVHVITSAIPTLPRNQVHTVSSDLPMCSNKTNGGTKTHSDVILQRDKSNERTEDDVKECGSCTNEVGGNGQIGDSTLSENIIREEPHIQIGVNESPLKISLEHESRVDKGILKKRHSLYGFSSVARTNRFSNALKTISAIVVSFMMCVIPSVIEMAVKIFSEVDQKVAIVTTSLLAMNAIMNPVFFVWRFHELREEICKMRRDGFFNKQN